MNENNAPIKRKAVDTNSNEVNIDIDVKKKHRVSQLVEFTDCSNLVVGFYNCSNQRPRYTIHEVGS